MNIPKIKRGIRKFLLSEEGRVSKKSILPLGLFVGALSIPYFVEAVHCSKHANVDIEGNILIADCEETCSVSTYRDNWCDWHGNSKHCNDSVSCTAVNHSNNISLESATDLIVAEHEHNIQSETGEASYDCHANC